MTNTETATDEVYRRCSGGHTRDCAWHNVMAIDENHHESGFEDEPELVENALSMIDSNCQC
jgi:hypothetical protein